MRVHWREVAAALAPGAVLALWALGAGLLFSATLEPLERQQLAAWLEPRLALLFLAWLVLSGALGALLLVHWMTCSQEAAVCAGAVITPTCTGWRWRVLERMRAACLRVELYWQEAALEEMTLVHALLPDEIQQQRTLVDSLRDRLAVATARTQP